MNKLPMATLRGDIAIVGLAGRFPGARTIYEFWKNLCDGIESITTFTAEELVEAGVDPDAVAAANYVKARGSLAGGDLFDASFFGFTPREAEIIDPQHRQFFECAWECLEHAGYDPYRYSGRIGIYGGSSVNSYAADLASDPEIVASTNDLQRSIGTRRDHLTTRVSYKLNLRGPSIDVQTACSTSLVAVHLACQAILNHECDMALAGGVSLRIPEKMGYLYYEGGIHSPDGHCRAFDAEAAGTVGGSGVGLVLLKRLEDARHDNDFVYAVIKGSAVNNDGGMKVGYTAPSITGQAQVIAAAHAMAEVTPETIGYVEAHGTGTPLGDPIEVSALCEVFPAVSEDGGPSCVLGAVKPNIGHLDTAAGVTGLIKTALILQNKTIPPTLHFRTPNPHTKLENSPFRVSNRIVDWHTSGTPRRAGVSSFGIGGTNAHVVLEEAAICDRPPATPFPELFIISGKTPRALDRASQNLASFLRQHPDLRVADVAHTLQVGRHAFDHRQTFVADSATNAAAILETQRPGQVYTNTTKPAARPIVFLFPGQGAQYPQAARSIYDREAVFRDQLDRCANLFTPLLGFDIRDVLYPAGEDTQDAANRMRNTLVAQPILFTVDYALAQLWMSWGVRPHAMIGHSLGEYVAACMSGVLSLEAAVALVAARARLMSALPGGAMVVIPLHEDDLVPMLTNNLSLAAANGPALQVVSGPKPEIDQLIHALANRQVECRRLAVSHAFHSPMMEPILDAFTAEVRRLKLAAPAIPYISNVTGTWITDADALDPEYFAMHLRHTVRFSEGLSELFATPEAILIEVGPGKALTAMAKTHPQKGRGQTILSSLHNSADAAAEFGGLLETLGRLWLTGVEVNWTGLHHEEPCCRTALPTYPFEPQEYRCRPRRTQHNTAGASGKIAELSDWLYVPLWQQTLAPYGSRSTTACEYLLFIERGSTGAAFADFLKSRGDSVTTVEAGSQFGSTPATFTINPKRQEDYELLYRQLAARNTRPDLIVHFWSLTEENSPSRLDASDIRQALAFYSLVYLVQAIGRNGGSRPIKLIAVSNNAHRVLGDEAICPEQALVVGPCRVIPKEYPFINCRNVDVPIPAGIADHARLHEQLAGECSSDSAESLVAYRGTSRWTPYYRRLPLQPAPASRLRDRGTYMITGGLGGIGAAIAQHLAKSVRARLVLVGRSEFPKEENWSEWLRERGDADPISLKIRMVQNLAGFGAEVFVARADVADADQMRAVVREAKSRFGVINGVIHAAGVAGGGVIELKTTAALENVLRPKVRGTRVLESVLDVRSLDFFILCSSLGAFFGRPGQVDYCAANLFLDAYAQSYSGRPGPAVVSVNWGAWSDAGMLLKEAERAGVGGESNEHEGKRTNHPLLGSCLLDTADRKKYLTRFSVKDQWVLEEHRIGGIAVVPGTSYLEIARAACQPLAGARSIQLQDVFFLAPLAVRDDEIRLIYIDLERQGDTWSFRITSPTNTHRDEPHAELAVGTVAFVEKGPATRHDVAALRAACNLEEVTPGDDLTLRFGDLGPRWHCLRKAYIGDRKVFSALTLPKEFVGDLDTFHLHPGLLDRANGTSKHFLVHESNYLPFSYRKLTIHRSLTASVYVYAMYTSAEHMGGEAIACNVTLMDTDGTELVVIEGFTQKRVVNVARAVDELTHRHSSDRRDGSNMNLLEKNLIDGMTSREGVAIFDRIVSSAVPAQVIVSPVNFEAALAQARRSALNDETREKHPEPEHVPPPAREEATPTTGQSAEAALAAIWRDVLGIKDIGVHDNFLELGGDSVQAMQIIARTGRIGMKCTVRQIYQHLTIAELAAVVEWTTGHPAGGTMETTAAV